MVYPFRYALWVALYIPNHYNYTFLGKCQTNVLHNTQGVRKWVNHLALHIAGMEYWASENATLEWKKKTLKNNFGLVQRLQFVSFKKSHFVHHVFKLKLTMVYSLNLVSRYNSAIHFCFRERWCLSFHWSASEKYISVWFSFRHFGNVSVPSVLQIAMKNY